jgi:O-antigen/teichoic acid export membrane protein
MNARRIFSSVFFNYLGAASVSLIGFVATPIVLGHLGKPAYGAWALIAAMIGYSSLLDLGVGLTTMRMVAERAHLSDREELRAIVNTGLVIYGIAGAIALVAGVGSSSVLAGAFHIRGFLHHDFVIAFTLMAVALGLTFPSGLYTGINQGFGHFREQNLIVIGQALLGTATTIVIVLAGGGLVPLAIGWTVSVLLGFAAKVVYAAKAFAILPNPRHFDRRLGRMLLGVSAWMFIINIANKLIWNTDAVVVGNVLGTVAVAHYAVALGPATAVRTVTDQFNSVTFTAAASLRAQDQTLGLQRLLLEATRVVAICIGPFVVLFLLWGVQFLTLWVGPSLASSAPTLVLLVVGMLASAVQATATQVLLAFEFQRRMAWVAIAEAVANLGCSVVLAHNLGIEGVALGTAIPTTITAFGYYLPKAAALLSVPLTDVLRRVLKPMMLYLGLYLAFRFAVPPLRFSSLPLFLAFAGVFLGSTVVAGLMLDRDGRQTYVGMIRSFRPQQS